MTAPIHVSDAEFEASVLLSTTPVIVDFWAPWCGPCRQIAPILEKIAGDYTGKVVVAKVNTDENPEWAQKYEVRGIPTMLFVAGGKVVYQQVGAVPAGYLRQMVDKFLETVAEPVAGAAVAAVAEPAAPEQPAAHTLAPAAPAQPTAAEPKPNGATATNRAPVAEQAK